MSFEVCPQCHSDGSACDLCGIRPMSEKSIAAAMELARMKLLAAERAEPMVPLRLVEDIQKEANHILRVLDGGHFLNAGEINGLMASIRAAREGAK